MKNFRNMMLMALVAAAMVALPQDLQAQERKPKAQVEMRDRREQRNPERARAMRDKDFSMMYKIVKKVSFDDNRIDIIRVAAIGSYFSSKQCAELLSLISFNDDKLKALEVMAPRIVYDKDIDRILKQFSFNRDKDKAMKILMKR
jgi:vacuolar-type H+-ATPase subunit I/STV1